MRQEEAVRAPPRAPPRAPRRKRARSGGHACRCEVARRGCPGHAVAPVAQSESSRTLSCPNVGLCSDGAYCTDTVTEPNGGTSSGTGVSGRNCRLFVEREKMETTAGLRLVRFTEATAAEQSGTAVQVIAGGLEESRWKAKCRLGAVWATNRVCVGCWRTPAGARFAEGGRNSSADTAETVAA